MQPVSYRRNQVPARGHSARRMALSAVHPQLPGCGGTLAERGLEISYETIRRWVLKFGPTFARKLRQPATSAERSVAPGRDGDLDSRQAHVPVASRR